MKMKQRFDMMKPFDRASIVSIIRLDQWEIPRLSLFEKLYARLIRESCKHVGPSIVKINLAFSQDDPLSSVCRFHDSDVFDVSIWISDLSNSDCELRSSSCRI